MRSIDKVYLLSEYFNGTDEEYLRNFKQRIKDSYEYNLLVRNVSIAENSFSKRSGELIESFNELKLYRIKTIEECFSAYGRVLFLLRLSFPNSYINPLHPNKDELEINVGDILFNFDRKDTTLSQISMNIDYTSKQKIEVFKPIYKNWIKEVHDQIMIPLEIILFKPRNLPKMKVFTPFHIFEIIFAIIVYGIFFVGWFTRTNPFSAYVCSSAKLYYFYPSLVIFVSTTIITISNIMDINIRTKKFYKYHYAYNHVIKKSNKIIQSFKDICSTLYVDVMKSFETNSKIETKVKKYDIFSDKEEMFVYLEKFNCRRRKVRKISYGEIDKAMFSIIALTVIFMIVCFFLVRGGIIK